MNISEDFLEQILTNAPSSETLFLALSKLKEEGQIKRVIQGCINALNFAPNDLRIRKLLAESYFETGLLSQAEKELDKVVSQLHDLLAIYRLQAELYAKQNRNEAALNPLKLYLAHHPEDREAGEILQGLEPAEGTISAEPPSVEEETAEVSWEETEREDELAEEDGLPDISTPTLAEVYFNQGQIHEALETYERVVAQNPDDDRSRKRRDELREMVGSQAAPSKEIGGDRVRAKNRKIIAVLEGWLANIREMSESPSSH